MKLVKFEISVLSKPIAPGILLYESPGGNQVDGLPLVVNTDPPMFQIQIAPATFWNFCPR